MTSSACRRLLCLFFLASSSGCGSKTTPKALPAQTAATATTPEESDAELKRFLDGMLVTSSAQAVLEAVWPNDEENEKQWWWVMHYVRRGFGIESPAELRAKLDKPPEKMNARDAHLLLTVLDYPTALAAYKTLLRQWPESCEAATSVARYTMYFEGPEAALKAITSAAPKDEPGRGGGRGCSVAEFLSVKARLLLKAHQLEAAKDTANQAIERDGALGSRTLVKILLATGKKKEALAQAERMAAMPGRQSDYRALFTLGLAQQENGLAEDAMRTWNVAAARWPKNRLLARALAGAKKTVFEWDDEEDAIDRHLLAKDVAFCGGMNAELGFTDRSRECYRLAEHLEPGAGLARQLVTLGISKPDEAFQALSAAVKPDSSTELMTAMAWILLRQGKLDESKAWVERTLELSPDDAKATSLMWEICGEQKDYVCVIEYRKRLGLPTHFNVAEYRDVNRAWQEQAIKNGEGLAAKEAPSADSPKPPRLSAIELIPLGERVPPELAGVEKALAKRFPGVRVSLGEREDLPPGSYKLERDQVLWEPLLERLRQEPGRIYVIENDLATYEGGFSFVRYDLAHGIAVVSLSRLRSLVGRPAPADTTLDPTVLPAVQRRLQSDLVGAIARLLGVSFPCPEKACSAHERRSVADFALREPAFCERHAKELAAALEVK